MPLSLEDIQHLEAAENWLERKHFDNCFEELQRINSSHREDPRELALRWKLFDGSEQHGPAAHLARVIQWRFPHEPAGYIWRAISLRKLGCTQEAYDEIARVVDKFDGLGTVPYLAAVFASELQQMNKAWHWLERAFATENGKELKLQALEEKALEPLWRRIGAL